MSIKTQDKKIINLPNSKPQVWNKYTLTIYREENKKKKRVPYYFKFLKLKPLFFKSRA